MPDHTGILGRQIRLVLNKNLAELVSQWSHQTPQSVFFCNVHMIMLAQEDQELATAMDQADCVFADGVPVAWLQSRLSGKDAQVIRGYEIMLAVCEHAARAGEKVGFLGSTDEVMEKLVENLRLRYSGLDVVCQYSPPFMPGELVSSDHELQSLTDSEVRWLFVGLGCPKQEKWIASYANKLNCHVFAVGAAFDWLSGLSSKPPAWMEESGLGWFYRLLHNFRGMWYRYLKYNTKFIFYIPKALYLKGRNGSGY